MKKFIIYTDGASRGNPGPASVGFVIQDEAGSTLLSGHEYLGIATNNIAEYKAVQLSLEALLKDFSDKLPCDVEFQGDSMLIMSQLSGKFKIKNEGLREICLKIKEIEPKVGRVTYSYTPRINNSIADSLANKALDEMS